MITRVSVVIPSYDCGEFILDAIRSAVSQTHRVFEIIVVDDGSRDNTQELLTSLSGEVINLRQENLGVCSARNRGVFAAKGDLIAFLDADDIWEPTKLEKQIRVFECDPEIGLVHCGLREFDGDTGQTIKFHLVGGEGWVADELALYDRPVVAGPGGSIIVKREVFDEVGYFDTDLTNGEDWEFCLRVALKYKFGFVAEPLVNYRNHGGNASKNIVEMERSTLLAWEKVFGTANPSISKLKRRSYSNLFKILAGSYLQTGNYTGFVRNVLKSIYYRPALIGFYLRSLTERSLKR